MKRREFLKQAVQRSVQLGASAGLGAALFSRSWLSPARADSGINAQSIQALKKATGASAFILTPSDPEYAKHTASHNRVYESVKPQVIALCLSTEAVREAVQWAISYGVGMRVRGGGHCFEDFSIGKELLIDMSRMNTISCDPASGRTGIQAGARLGDVYSRLDKEGLILPAGSCFGVGISGLTLGGGHGYFSRKWGLTCDHLVGVTMVVVDQDVGGAPKARVVKASATQNPDLFWACRGGGGGSFGIVTEFQFQARRTEMVAQFYLTWSTPDAPKVIAAWQDFAPYTDDRLATTLVINARDGAISSVDVSGLFIGPVAELEPLIQKLLQTGTLLTPPNKRFFVRNMAEAVGRYNGAKPLPNRYFKSSSDYAFKPLTSGGIEALLKAAKALPSGSARVQLEAYGGAISKVRPGDTAFAHRKAQYCVQYSADWTSPEEGAIKKAWVANMRKAMSAHFSGYCYVNYCDLSVTNYQRAYFGDNAPRLSRIKKQVDPHGFFHHGQSVKPA